MAAIRPADNHPVTCAAFPSVRSKLRANRPACRRVALPFPDGELAGVEARVRKYLSGEQRRK